MDDKKLTILLADDQKIITESLSAYLTNYADDLLIVGIAANGREAVNMVHERQPDIILMDV